MSLLQTSDDSLQNILFYLTERDISRLLTTGSKLLTLRVRQNATDIVYVPEFPFIYPFAAYKLPNMQSLSIVGIDEDTPRYISTSNRSPLPLEPVLSMKKLVLEFPTSAGVLAPDDAGRWLNWAFPNLTSLVVRSLAPQSAFSVDEDWPNHLPETLTSLTVELSLHRSLSTSIFESLPKGLQTIRILSEMDGDTLSLERFENLVAFELHHVSFPPTISFPNSLEDFRWHAKPMFGLYGRHTGTKFPISKMPPKIRVWVVTGLSKKAEFQFLFDAIAPPTLEALDMSWRYYPLEALQKHFHCENLKRLPRLHHPVPTSWIASLTRLESFTDHSGLECENGEYCTTLQLCQNL